MVWGCESEGEVRGWEVVSVGGVGGVRVGEGGGLC